MLCVCLLAATTSLAAQDVPPGQAAPRTGFLDCVYRDEAGAHKYVLFVPAGYTPEKKYPVVLFLHGAFERGDDGRKQVEVGLGPYVKARSKTFPTLVVFPQADKRDGQAITSTWSPTAPAGKRALAILKEVEQDYNIDPRRRILTGWSMGGFGVWQLAAADPQHWSALVPISGGGDPALAKNVAGVPIWAFHGAEDATVPPAETRALIQAVKAAGGQPRYSEIADVGHYAFKAAYDNDALYHWMWNPSAATSNPARLLVKPGVRTPPAAYDNRPFRPAVEIPGAVSLRIGQDALQAISYSIPSLVPRNALHGRIRDIHDTTTASGRTFQVTFSGIRYDADLYRTYLQTTPRGRLLLQLGLQNVRMTIGATYVRGSGRSAAAGPISIVIGHRRPVWLQIEAAPYVARRQIGFQLRSVGFHIPDDNWSISPPAGVRTRGLGMTRERVTNGLMRGLSGSKARIENEIRAIAPMVLREAQQSLDISRLTEAMGDVWPLPVYRPRMRLYPERVAVDDAGLTLSLGLAVAAIDPRQAPRTPKRLASVGTPIENVPRTGDLRLHVAGGVMEPLTELLIQADVARIHVNDVPHDAFARFADRGALADAIPDLNSLPEGTLIWSELILAAPLTVDGGDRDAETPSGPMQFSMPAVVISTAIKTDPASAAWTPYAEFRFSIQQQARATMVRRGFRRRDFEMDWDGTPHIETTARFAPGYEPRNPQIDTEKIATLFAESWKTWTESGPVARRRVNDVRLGTTTLRLSSAGWSAPHLYLGFSAPGVRLTNRSNRPLEYIAKGPYSNWSSTLTLPPGETHEFDDPYPILFRRRVNGRYEIFTLPVGSHSEYRVPLVGGAPRIFQARDDLAQSWK